MKIKNRNVRIFPLALAVLLFCAGGNTAVMAQFSGGILASAATSRDAYLEFNHHFTGGHSETRPTLGNTVLKSIWGNGESVSNGTVELPSIFSDNMVLQRNSSVRVWGRVRSNAVVAVKADWHKGNTVSTADDKGYWETKIPTPEAGGPYSITISSGDESKVVNNILIGEVWICAGQSNMSMPVKGFDSTMPIAGSAEAIAASAGNSDIRMFTAAKTISKDKASNVKGDWQAASVNTTPKMSAVGYFYAVELKKALKVPIGIINLSWGGSTAQAWMSQDLLRLFPEVDLSSSVNMDGPSQQRIPSALFNGMFSPVSKFSVKGILWYQGEDNVGKAALYAKLLPALAKEWRTVIGEGDIPFYYVQLAPYKYKGSDRTEAALLREVQWNSQSLIPNSGMVTTGDLGNENQIHPPRKKEIAQRLSYLALTKAYGIRNLPYTSRIYQKKETNGNKITLTFEDGGLVLRGAPQSVFAIAGSDSVFYAADAKITGKNADKIEIWSDKVTHPVNVRYAFRNYFESVLYNTFLIPVSPFRTDTLEK